MNRARTASLLVVGLALRRLGGRPVRGGLLAVCGGRLTVFAGIAHAGVPRLLVHSCRPFMRPGRLLVTISRTAVGRGGTLMGVLGALCCQLRILLGDRLPVLQVRAPFDQLFGPSGGAVLRFL